MTAKDGKLAYHVYTKKELEPLLNESNHDASS